MVFSLGGGSGGSKNKSWSSTDVWGPQGQALEQMYGMLPGVYQNSMWGMPGMRQTGMNNVMPFMKGFQPGTLAGFNQQIGGGQTGNFTRSMDPSLRASLDASLNGPSQTSQLYGSIMGGDSSYVDPAIRSMYGDVERNLNTGAFKQSDMQAAARGQSGSNFHAQQRGTAAAEQYARANSQANQMRAGAHLQDLGMKLGIAEQADANKLALQQSMMGQYNTADQNTLAALNGANQLQNMGMNMFNPWMAMSQFPWMNMMNYANVVGDPTLTGKSHSRGSSSQNNFGVGIG